MPHVLQDYVECNGSLDVLNLLINKITIHVEFQ